MIDLDLNNDRLAPLTSRPNNNKIRNFILDLLISPILLELARTLVGNDVLTWLCLATCPTPAVVWPNFNLIAVQYNNEYRIYYYD
jgi:hypothetical protein